MLKQLILKIKAYKHDLVRKLRKLKDSEEFKAFFSLFFEIVMYGGLALLAYLSLSSSNLLIKLLGFGSGLWLFKEKILPMATELFGSVSLVKIYGR